MASGIPSRRDRSPPPRLASSASPTEKRGDTCCARSTNKAHRGRVDARAHVQRAHRPQPLVGDAESFAAGGHDLRTSPSAPGWPRSDRRRHRARARSCRTPAAAPGPPAAAATLWATLRPGCWVMPSTAATASGTAAGSVTAASSKNQTPSGNSSANRASYFQRQPGFADPAHPGQRHQPMRLYRGLQLGDLGLASDEARGRSPQVPRTRVQRPQRRKLRA